MRVIRFKAGGAVSFGITEGHTVVRLAGEPFDRLVRTDEIFDPAAIEVLAPVTPSKVVAVGLNYRDHARELNMELPKEPVLFMKPPSTVIGPGRDIVYPDASEQVDFEAELAIVVGKAARTVSAAEAPDHIFGYTAANDITARDLQRRDGQWTRAKSFDTFCPLGPHIETELDPRAVQIKLEQNGLVRQESSTAQMIFNAYELVSFISGVMTLLPGDVILTGTPPGVGPATVGDSLTVTVEGIGRLENTVVR